MNKGNTPVNREGKPEIFQISSQSELKQDNIKLFSPKNYKNTDPNEPITPMRQSKEPEIKRVSIINEDDKKMNFNKWVICLISLGILLISPMVCYLGIEAASYGFEKVIVDKALILMSVLAFILAVITIIGTIYTKYNILIFSVYMDLVMIVFFSIFAIGCVTFSATMEMWIYENWGAIRSQASILNIEDFQEDFQNSLISLGFFSFTISLGLIISVISILFLIPAETFLSSVFSSFALIFIVFSSATIAISIQTREAFKIWFQISDEEEWISFLFIVVSIIWTMVGCLGYYASLRNHKKILMGYLSCMILTNLLLCALGCFLIYFSFNIEIEVSEKWDAILQYLMENNGYIPIVIFTQNLDEVVKFAGLYALAFFIFNSIGIATSFFQLRKILKMEKNLDSERKE